MTALLSATTTGTRSPGASARRRRRGCSIAVAGVDGGVLAGRVSVIADALPQIISMPLLGLRPNGRAGRSTDNCAGSRTAWSARQNAAW